MKQLAHKKWTENRSNKHKKNLHNSLGNLHNCGRVQVDGSHPSGFSLDTKSPSGSSSSSSRWITFLLKNHRRWQYAGIILFGVVGCLTTRLLCEKRTKGHDRRRRKANDTIVAHSQQRQRQKAIKTIVGCLLLVNFISLLPSLPLCLNGGGGIPNCPTPCDSCCLVLYCICRAPAAGGACFWVTKKIQLKRNNIANPSEGSQPHLSINEHYQTNK